MTIYVIMDHDEWCGEMCIGIADNRELAEQICDFNGGESYYDIYDTEQQKDYWKKLIDGTDSN